ncbi:MAG: CPBP family intramembrane metalloprotease [Acidobacteria bacterium]|nr:CPBP family intramembrane metalloprotease [Acidobacteriota bacterium]
MGNNGSARFVVLLFQLLLVLVVVAAGWLAMLLSSILTMRTLGLRPSLVVSEAVLVLPGALAALALGLGRDEIGLRTVDRRTAFLSLAAGATLWVTSLGVFEVQYALWSPPPGYLEAFRQLHAALEPSGPADALVSVLAIAIAPAVCEEALFRGIVLPSVLRVLGGTAAVAASALLFGAIHLDFTSGVIPTAYRVPFACAIGVGLALLRLRTGSLLPPVVAHATLNTITFLVAPWMDDPGQALPDPRPGLGAALLATGVAATALAFRFARGVDSTKGRA